jgi:hypothetical protein
MFFYPCFRLLVKLIGLILFVMLSTGVSADVFYTIEKKWPIKENPIISNDYSFIVADDNNIFLLQGNRAYFKRDQPYNISILNRNGWLVNKFKIKTKCDNRKINPNYYNLELDSKSNIIILVDCQKYTYYK